MGLIWNAIPYRIAFRRPLATAHGTLRSRRGWWLVATDSAGRIGLGEVAPLTGFATETYDEAEEGIRDLLRTGLADPANARIRNLPALGAGIQTARIDLSAREQGIRVVEGWTDQPRERIACHCLLGELEADAIASEAASAVAKGYRTLKIKIGVLPLQQDARRIAAVRERIGEEIRLRADANGAYDTDTAIAVLRKLEPFHLEFIEQPVRDSLEDLKGKTGVAIAADESIGSASDAHNLIACKAADVLIVKPMAIGGPAVAMEIATMAAEAGIGVVITSILDSAVGISAALHVAAALPVAATCGLATLDHLEPAPVYGLQPALGGSIRLPTETGLGVTIDPNLIGDAQR